MNVRSVTVFRKRMKQRRLATGSATKPIFEGKKDSVKAYYDQNREIIFSLQTSSISGKSKGKEILQGRSIPFGCNMSMFIRAQG